MRPFNKVFASVAAGRREAKKDLLGAVWALLDVGLKKGCSISEASLLNVGEPNLVVGYPEVTGPVSQVRNAPSPPN